MSQSTDTRNSLRTALFWGIGLLLSGIFLLLVNQHVFDGLAPYWQWVVAGVLAAAGVAFVIGFARDTIHWWPIVPGFTLLTAGLIVFLTTTQAALTAETLGAILFFGIALAFVVIYILDRRSWWAIIPGGLLVVLSATTVLSNLQLSANTLSAMLFVGMGFVFLLVYVLGPIKREVWWALIPGGALILFGLFSFVVTNARSNVQVLLADWWPLLLVVAGILLLVRVFTSLSRPAPLAGPPPPAVPRVRDEEPMTSPGVATIRPQADVSPLIRPAPEPEVATQGSHAERVTVEPVAPARIVNREVEPAPTPQADETAPSGNNESPDSERPA